MSVSTAYHQGDSGTHGEHTAHGHVTPLSTYVKVFVALLVLTVLTVAVSYVPLGGASLFVAMVIAVAKAALVVMYFMHLKGDDPFHTFVFAGTLIFIAIFFTLTFADLTTRDEIQGDWGNKGWRYEHGETLDLHPGHHGGGHGEGGQGSGSHGAEGGGQEGSGKSGSGGGH